MLQRHLCITLARVPFLRTTSFEWYITYLHSSMPIKAKITYKCDYIFQTLYLHFFTTYHASHFNSFSTNTHLPDDYTRPYLPLTIYTHDH